MEGDDDGDVDGEQGETVQTVCYQQKTLSEHIFFDGIASEMMMAAEAFAQTIA